MDREFGYILGATLGDGNVQYYKRMWRIRLGVKDLDFMDRFLACYRAVTGRAAHYRTLVKPYWKSPIHTFEAHNRPLCLRIIPFKEDKRRLLSLSEDEARGFIEGIYDAEGSVVVSHRTVSVCNTDFHMLRAIQILLSRFDIATWGRHRRPPSPSKKPWFGEVNISRFSSIRMFHDNFTLAIERKRKRIAELAVMPIRWETPLKTGMHCETWMDILATEVV